MSRGKVAAAERGQSKQHAHFITKDDFGEYTTRKNINTSTTFALWIRQLLQNWRQGTVGVKDRSEVSLSGKKPWKQKGTGRARAGTARSPLWRKGGVIHGPQPRDRMLKINKKQKEGVLSSLFWHFLDKEAIYRVSDVLAGDVPKTSWAYQVLQQLDLVNKKVVLFVSPADVMVYASFVNIPNVQLVYFDEVNAFDLASTHCWLVLEKDIETFKQMVMQWL